MRLPERGGVLLDTSVLIAAERGELNLEPFSVAMKDTPLFLASISASELLHGVHRLRRSKQKVRAESFVEAVIGRIPVIPFDLRCARTHARVGADLARRGVIVGAHDLLIAATALAHGFKVATKDLRSFRKIPDLDVDTA